MTNRRGSTTARLVKAKTGEQLFERTQEHIRPLIGMIDELNEVGAEDEQPFNSTPDDHRESDRRTPCCASSRAVAAWPRPQHRHPVAMARCPVRVLNTELAIGVPIHTPRDHTSHVALVGSPDLTKIGRDSLGAGCRRDSERFRSAPRTCGCFRGIESLR